jgi:hypothetical protein
MKDWGLTPSEWALEPRWSQLKMLAYSSVDDEMKSEEAKEVESMSKQR